ncbi:MAG TPA: thioredoxin family protein [Nitrososphaeraceae archaeon]|nr:thioredoxin family protein [Nitrososphaeraceae archaeon]
MQKTYNFLYGMMLKAYSMVKTPSSQTLKTGQNAPDFKLRGVDGKTYSLHDFTSKSLLIVFICNHCPYVKARIGDIINLQSKFKNSELQVVGINSNDPNYIEEGFDNMIKFANERKLNFPYLIDDTQYIAKSYGAVCTPDPFLFDEQRRLVFHGKINDAVEPEMTPKIQVMENNIRKILKGEKIEKDFDPSIGCSIKWKN